MGKFNGKDRRTKAAIIGLAGIAIAAAAVQTMEVNLIVMLSKQDPLPLNLTQVLYQAVWLTPYLSALSALTLATIAWPGKSGGKL